MLASDLNNATLYDAAALTIASANVGGTLGLTSGSTIGQSGAIVAGGISATTTNGAITLTNASNAIGTAALATGGSDNASLTDTSALIIASANVGGTLTLYRQQFHRPDGRDPCEHIECVEHRRRDHAHQCNEQHRHGDTDDRCELQCRPSPMSPR